MAFLDNSGDIILDAVLTDTGRMRLARGDGSFRIAKFCLGDDEINYGTYDKNHASGSAYYDLQVLQTPVLEAFTNNTSQMNSKLVSIPRTSLMYLPEIVLNTNKDNISMHTTAPSQNVFLVAVDIDTETTLSTDGVSGVINGFSLSDTHHWIRLDQGLNTTEISANERLEGDLIETQYIIEIDNRFGSIWANNGQTSAKVSFIDDDNIASYYLSYNTDRPAFIKDLELPDARGVAASVAVIAGPRGTKLRFTIKASLELSTNNYLFGVLGGTGLSISGVTGETFRYLDSVVRVTGATTGYRVDVPIRFVKKI